MKPTKKWNVNVHLLRKSHEVVLAKFSRLLLFPTPGRRPVTGPLDTKIKRKKISRGRGLPLDYAYNGFSCLFERFRRLTTCKMEAHCVCCRSGPALC